MKMPLIRHRKTTVANMRIAGIGRTPLTRLNAQFNISNQQSNQQSNQNSVVFHAVTTAARVFHLS